MATPDVSPVNPHGPEQPEQPSGKATLGIQSMPVNITLGAQGAAAKPLILGVIGPIGTILAGHYVGLPTSAIVLICTLQIAAVIVHRGD